MGPTNEAFAGEEAVTLYLDGDSLANSSPESTQTITEQEPYPYDSFTEAVAAQPVETGTFLALAAAGVAVVRYAKRQYGDRY